MSAEFVHRVRCDHHFSHSRSRCFRRAESEGGESLSKFRARLADEQGWLIRNKPRTPAQLSLGIYNTTIEDFCPRHHPKDES